MNYQQMLGQDLSALFGEINTRDENGLDRFFQSEDSPLKSSGGAPARWGSTGGMSSSQGKLKRVRKPRAHISYDAEPDDSQDGRLRFQTGICKEGTLSSESTWMIIGRPDINSRATAQKDQPTGSTGSLAAESDLTNEPLSSDAGEEVGRNLQLLRILGQGRFGCVYEGIVRTTSRRVAVKVIREGLGRVSQLAINEAMIGARIVHPNIVRVFALRRAGLAWIVVMELVEGFTFDKTHDPPAAAVRIAAGLQSALQFLYSSQVLLRDIKPGNILIRPNGQPVLIDLGLAVDLELHDASSAGVAGTPWYMPPESFEGELHAGFDCYSAGVTVTQALSDTEPMRTDRIPGGMDGLLEAKRRGLFRSWLEEISKSIRPNWRSWVLALTADSPDARLAALAAPLPESNDV